MTLHSRSLRIAAGLVAVCMALVPGCSGPKDPYARLPIKGSVTLDGKPIASGYIIFEPLEKQPTQSGGMIQNGQYVVPKEAGPVPGKYSVGIFAEAVPLPPGIDAATPEGELASLKLPGQIVPKRYGAESTLTAVVQQDGDNQFDFTLSTQKKP